MQHHWEVVVLVVHASWGYFLLRMQFHVANVRLHSAAFCLCAFSRKYFVSIFLDCLDHFKLFCLLLPEKEVHISVFKNLPVLVLIFSVLASAISLTQAV